MPNTQHIKLSHNREAWLMHAVEALTPLFQAKGYQLPKLKVSCGFASTGSDRHIGQCFPSNMTSSGENELFISPVLDEPVKVLATLVHEMVHAIDDCKSSHGKAFKQIATAVGLTGKMRSTHAGETLTVKLEAIAMELGDYPHQKILLKVKTSQARPQPKARCDACGYEVRVGKKWQHLGAPYCPQHGTEMQVSDNWNWADPNAIGGNNVIPAI